MMLTNPTPTIILPDVLFLMQFKRPIPKRYNGKHAWKEGK